MQTAAAPAACAAPLSHPSDLLGVAAAGGHPDAIERLGRVEPRGASGPRGAGPPGGVGPPGEAAPLGGGALLAAVGPLGGFGSHVCGEPLDEVGPRGGVGFLVGSGHLAACVGPAAWRHLAAAAHLATEPPPAAASLASEPPAFGLWPHRSEGSAGCQTWG